MKIFYNSSMPRAGSTLIQQIIGQHPDFYVTPTSGLLELFFSSKNAFSSNNEFKAQDKDEMEKAFYSFCKGGAESYFSSLTDKKYIMDKSRGWGAYYNLLNNIFPNPKIICMVRDLRDIVASMEKKYQQNPLHIEPLVNEGSLIGTTPMKRAELFMNTIPVGLALDRMNNNLMNKVDILYIKYEGLMEFPNETMEHIYNYLELDYYQHDFNNIQQITNEDDRFMSIYGDHKITSNTLSPPKSNWTSVYTKQIGDMIYDSFPWYFETFGYKK